MIKEEKTIKEVIVKRRYCDVCGKELRWTLASSAARCEYCKKDLCESCIGNEEDTSGDYRIVWCKTCWDLGNDYRPKIEKLHKEIDKLYEEWQNKCLNK